MLFRLHVQGQSNLYSLYNYKIILTKIHHKRAILCSTVNTKIDVIGSLQRQIHKNFCCDLALSTINYKNATLCSTTDRSLTGSRPFILFRPRFCAISAKIQKNDIKKEAFLLQQ